MIDIAKLNLSSLPFKSLFRYAIVGGATNLIGYLTYLFLTHLGSDPKVAMSCLYILGSLIGYFGNRNWTFEDSGRKLTSAFRYSIAHLLGYLINLTLLIFFVNKLGYPHQYVQAAAVVIVAAFLFVVFKIFVFQSTKSREHIK